MKQITLLAFLLSIATGSYAQDLRITEIMYNPNNSDSTWEWVEVYNAGTELVDLADYVIDDNSGAAYTEANIQTGTILSGQSAVLFNASAISETDFLQVWGTVNLIPVTRWSSLNNGGDTIGIWNSFEMYSGDSSSQENVIEQVIYAADGEIWPEDDGAASIYLTNLDADNNLGTNWSLSTVGAVTPLFKTYTSTVFETNDGQDIGSPGLSDSADTEKPTIACPEGIDLATDIENCGSTVPVLIPTGMDNITEELIFKGLRTDGLELTEEYPVGLTIITWTAIDEAGNVSEPCKQPILITDETAPSISCPEPVEVLSTDGDPITIDIDLATASDVCDGIVVVTGIRSDEKELEEPFIVGETTITWRATDDSGNVAECEQLVTVNFTASMEKVITSFSITNQLDDAILDNENKTVLLRVPFGTDVDVLVPTIEISEAATIDPETGIPQNFTNTITYTVTAQDGSEELWMVSVEIEEEEENENELSATSFMLVNADTNEDLFLIAEGMTIDIKDLPTLHLDVRVITTEDVESVRLSLDGAQSILRTENVVPYALFGDSPVGEYIGNDFVVGAYMLTAIPYSEDSFGGDVGKTLTLSFELFDKPVISVTEFMLVDADTNEDLFFLTEGMQIDINTLPTLNIDIRANTSEDVESVQLQLEGNIEIRRTENFEPYALYGDSPIGVYNGKEFTIGAYRISAFPYSLDDLMGEMGPSVSVNFELVNLPPILSVTSFTLVNADTYEDIFVLTDGMQVEISSLPTLNLDIRANATDDVESMSLSISGKQTASRTENVAPFAVFGDFPAGNYNGSDFESGDYNITAIGYAKAKLSGEMGEPLSIDFQLIDTDLSAKQANQMKVYPNPASSQATLKFNTPEKLAVIYLYDALGREVGEYGGDKVRIDEGYILDINSIPNGIYYIKSYDENGGSYQKQMVIKK